MAAQLEQYLRRQRDSRPADMAREVFTARVLIAVLDHRIGRERALRYVQAGVAHHEVGDWEQRRRSGENIQSAIDTLAALRLA